MRKVLRRSVKLGLLAGVGYAAWRAWSARERAADDPNVQWHSAPFPFPPEPHVHVPETVLPGGGPETEDLGASVDTAHVDVERAWVEPIDGECPITHPVKVKTGSGIYHVPGAANYARTHADRCYRNEQAADADGYRPSKH